MKYLIQGRSNIARAAIDPINVHDRNKNVTPSDANAANKK